MNRILIVEDEVPIAQLIEMSLARAGYQCEAVNDGCAAADKIEQNNYDLVLLDIMLPGLDGYELLEYLRPMGTPVIFITAKGTLGDRVRGLNLGADDYITKPFNPSELVARVKSQLRRYTQLGAMQVTEKQIAIRGLVLDTESKTVTVDGEAVRMTPLEYKILELLCRHPGKVFSTEEIYRQVWNDEVVSDNAIAVHIRHIREKIEINPREPRYLKVVWGVGYKIEKE